MLLLIADTIAEQVLLPIVRLILINDTPKLVFFLYPSFLCFHTNKNMNDVQPPEQHYQNFLPYRITMIKSAPRHGSKGHDKK
jgi:hypothetical protein